MKKTQWALIGGALGLLLLLFSLPKVVVSEQKDNGGLSGKPAATAPNVVAGTEVHSGEEAESVVSLKKLMATEQNSASFYTFADSLGNLYFSLQKFDSAAKYTALGLGEREDAVGLLKVAGLYLRSTQLAMDPQKRSQMAGRLNEISNRVLALEPDNVDAKVFNALALINGSGGMQNVLKLRALATEHPDNRLAALHLGILSVETGQFDKAVERLGPLTTDNNDAEAALWFGFALDGLGKEEEAVEQLKNVIAFTNDPFLASMAENKLSELK